MKCEFCHKPVVGQSDVVIVQGKGPAHEFCFQKALLNEKSRQFAGLDLTRLQDDVLEQLLKMVMAEVRSREADSGKVVLFDDQTNETGWITES